MTQDTLPLGVVGSVPSSPAETPAPEKPKRPSFDFFNLFALKTRGVPEGWRWSSIQAIGDLEEKDRARMYSEMEGYVHDGTKFKSGKNAGKRKPGCAVAGTKRKFIFTMAEFDTFLRDWEVETGLCHQCEGTGEELAGWSAKDGQSLRKCTRCFGTGKAHP
ncbi:MAG: hypothetical protein JNM17_13130 [Archangium sp.]|nr:hypothetical protein [Archangium sp.]